MKCLFYIKRMMCKYGPQFEFRVAPSDMVPDFDVRPFGLKETYDFGLNYHQQTRAYGFHQSGH